MFVDIYIVSWKVGTLKDHILIFDYPLEGRYGGKQVLVRFLSFQNINSNCIGFKSFK